MGRPAPGAARPASPMDNGTMGGMNGGGMNGGMNGSGMNGGGMNGRMSGGMGSGNPGGTQGYRSNANVKDITIPDFLKNKR